MFALTIISFCLNQLTADSDSTSKIFKSSVEVSQVAEMVLSLVKLHRSDFREWWFHAQCRTKIYKQDTNYRNSIPAKKRLVITLCYLAKGSSQQALSLSVGVGKSTVSNMLIEVCDVLVYLLAVRASLYIRPPLTEEK